MLKNYFKITLRNLQKQKVYAAINVIGLAVGIAFCALIFLFVRDELTFDRFHVNADRLHRISRVSFAPDGTVEQYDSSLPFPAGPALVADLPEVEAMVRFFRLTHFVRHDERAFEEEVYYADPAFLTLFTFPLQYGDPQTALSGPNSLVLTESTAQKYFGEEPAMGQPLWMRIGEQTYEFTVSGIAEDPPGNSSYQFEIVIPIARLFETDSYFRERETSWTSSAFKTFVLLREHVDAASVEAKMPAFRKKYYPDAEANLRERGLWTGDGIPTTYAVQPLTDIHLQPEIGGIAPTSNPIYSYILAAIALGVLLIACINFMTLAIGRSTRRATEVGVRKVVGASRRQLMLQFWGEALLLSGIALVAGLILAQAFLPIFNDLAGKSLRFDLARDATTGLALVGLMIVTGLIAGSYPAVVLSGFRPADTLKNRLQLSGSNGFTRSLVVVQFGLSVFLICSTLIMLDQLDYLQSRSLGFDKEHLVVIPTNGVSGADALDRFRNELAGRAEIQGLTGASSSFARGVMRRGFEHEGKIRQVALYHVESDYMDVMNMDLVAGRSFNPHLATDSSQAVIVNETLVRDFGWSDPLGQTLTGFTGDPSTDPIVIGVVQDINYTSLHQEVAPMALQLGPRNRIHTLMARLSPGDIPGSLTLLQHSWQQVSPDVPFQYSFLDDDLDEQYRAEQRWSRIVGYGSLFAIGIACLGLFGLAALTVTARTKEIGIRKVLGATAVNLTMLLSKDFALLVLLAVGLAAPAAYYVMQKWLEDFAYRIDISWSLFVLAGIAALAIALLPVGYQALKAALADPVRSLRYE